ncbi:hypothetical protein [Winogradskyella sp. 3972H.M.0a.05]|uniref:hypothetical protein n=1 Tax=Winogradskyella sp. 3972H.M.0a.05 TaxID=2950277 RepID=UPI003397D917
MVIISKYIVPKGYTGIALFPFVFLKEKYLISDATLINHEKIHLRQQLELLILPFYLFYFLEFALRLIQYKDWSIAYRNISFEREAYKNENDLDYLKSRSFWAFLKHL